MAGLNAYNLTAKLTIDNKEYELKLEQSGKSAASFSSKASTSFKSATKAVMAFIGGISTAAGTISALATKAINFGDDIDKTSQKLGLSNSAYQKWSVALQMAGAGVGNLQMAVRQLNNFYDELSTGQGEAIETLKALGIEYADFVDMDNDTKLETIITALQGLEDQTDKTRIAQQLFGTRTYMELLPLLNQEAGSVQTLFDELEDMNILLSDDMIKSSASLDDKLTMLKYTIQSVGAILLSNFYEPIEKIVGGLQKMATGSDEALKEIEEGVSDLIGKTTEKLPEFVDKASEFLLLIIDGIFSGDKLTNLATSLIKLVEKLLFKIIDMLPELISALMSLVNALLVTLTNIDWTTLLTSLISTIQNALLDLLLDENFLANIIKLALTLFSAIIEAIVSSGISIYDRLFDLFASEEGRNKLKRIGVNIANAIIEGLNMLGEFVIPEFSIGNWKIWDETAVKLFDRKPIEFANGTPQGKWLEDFKGSLLLAGEGNQAEIVAHGSHGTGVSNLEDIEGAFVSAMSSYGIKEIIEKAVTAVVNALAPAILQDKNIVVNVNERMTGNVVDVTDKELKVRGKRPLTDVTNW